MRFLHFFLILSAIAACKQKQPPKQKAGFEKVIFHTSGCFGTCPTYHLEINNNKQARLHAEQVYKQHAYRLHGFESDTAKVGNFEGLLSDSLFNKLAGELNTIGLDSLSFDGATCCDGSVITIIVYYDGKRKFLKSMFPPEKANNLIHYLYEACTSKQLKRVNGKFEIEGEGSDVTVPSKQGPLPSGKND